MPHSTSPAPRLRVLAALLSASLTSPVLASEPPDAPLRAHLTKAGDTPRIDGSLADPVWQQAPVFDSFHEAEPRKGNRAPDTLRTTVQLVIDDQSLVVGVRAYDSDAQRRSGTLARRDKVGQDQDFIGVWIDPTGHGSAAQFVRINTLGVLSDGIHRADDDESDLGPDFPVDGAVQLLPDGYSVELRWPLSSLRFPYADGKPWRAMIERSVPHAGALLLLSAPLATDALSYIAPLHTIEGMGDTVNTVRDRSFLELKPELTLRRVRERNGGERSHASEAALGLDINLRPRADWVINATLNPDFSQVEIDAPTSQGARRIALSLPEKRGFFLESSDVLGLPLAAFYSRTVADPAWGLRATWRASGADASAMSLRDQEGGVVLRGGAYGTGSFLQTGRTQASLARGRWHGKDLLAGAFASSRDYSDGGRNTVVGVDGQWSGAAGGDQLKVTTLLMHSTTSAAFEDDTGPVSVRAQRGGYLWTRFSHRSDDWFNEAVIEAVDPRFVNDNGFVPQTGIGRVQFDINRRLGPQRVDALDLDLYEFELHLGAKEIRTLSDPLNGVAGNEIVESQFQPGIWMFGPRQTRFFTNLGFDRHRAQAGGKLHRTPALHLGFESSPLPWLVRLNGELTLGRQLDTDADRVGPGGNAMLDVGMRFALPRGWAVELDQQWNRAWVRGTLGNAAFSDNGWRWLGILHTSAQDSFRLLAQNTWSARRNDGITLLEPWAERQIHRSLLYRHLWRHGRSVSLGFVKEKTPEPSYKSKALTFKFQWEV